MNPISSAYSKSSAFYTSILRFTYSRRIFRLIPGTKPVWLAWTKFKSVRLSGHVANNLDHTRIEYNRRTVINRRSTVRQGDT